jgi:hypothetical protein
MVEQVEEIELEVHLHPFDDLEVLPQGGIYVAVAGGHCRSRRLNSDLTQLEAVHGVGVRI